MQSLSRLRKSQTSKKKVYSFEEDLYSLPGIKGSTKPAEPTIGSIDSVVSVFDKDTYFLSNGNVYKCKGDRQYEEIDHKSSWKAMKFKGTLCLRSR